jgi:hypothetical protein
MRRRSLLKAASALLFSAPLVAAGCASGLRASNEVESDESMVTSSTYEMLGFAHSPRQVLLPLQVNDRGFGVRLYDIVQSINETDGLRGTEGPNAAISVLTWASREDQWLLGPTPDDGATQMTGQGVLDQLKTKIRSAHGLRPNDRIPNFDVVQTGGQSNFAFLQDLFEMIAVKTAGSGPKLAIVDLSKHFEHGDGSMMNEAFRTKLGAAKLPASVAPHEADLGTDDDGGNLEVTHEGRPYLGSSSSDALRTSVRNITGQAPIVLPTNWLFVGHVDEYITLLPHADACGAALVHSDPLEAINIMRQKKAVPVIPREDLEGTGQTIRNEEDYAARFLSSLKYFVRPGSENKEVLELADFDRSKPVRDYVETPNVDIEFLGNLHAYEEIQKGVAELKTQSQCLQKVVALPTLFYRSKGISGEASLVQEEITTGYTAATGYLNLVSLRNHVVIAKEPKDFFGPVVRERLGSVLGGAAHVHEIDASYYEQGAGSVHCTTNVIRSAERWR